MDLRELYTDIIKEHSMSNHNRRKLTPPFISKDGKNPSCGDEIQLELQLQDGIIVDAAFTGEGCAISQASVSIMIDLAREKTPEEMKTLAHLFLDMAQRVPLSEEQLEQLEEAAALQNVSNMPARVKCATMPWHTMLSALEEN